MLMGKQHFPTQQMGKQKWQVHELYFAKLCDYVMVNALL
jgi:hypothetical protein